ncbi:hypothetical protein JTE90_026399 [Oedothorax gibbosus]|uniref:acid phosphatase n=1 Tax=Oedothorax gibbosus TaxID=931172 RepID=A0AAV6VGG1_9ARAC|nr:hypothetical protein JTE90_026399 [Oedothorax gibbosus]
MNLVLYSAAALCHVALGTFQFQTNRDHERELKLIQVLFRHGHRTPFSMYPNDPIPESYWIEGLGALTKLGRVQHYAVGQYLRRRYETFLSYLPQEVHCLSSGTDRCLYGAYSVLSGMYPPPRDRTIDKDLYWQPIPVEYRPESTNKYLQSIDNCPTSDIEKIYTLRKSEAVAFVAKYKSFYEYWSNCSGQNITDYGKAGGLYKTLLLQKTLNLTIPDWAEQTWEELSAQGDMSYYFHFRSKLTHRLRAGPLLGLMLNKMRIKMKNPDSIKKAYLYSGHGSNIAAVLQSLDLFNKKIPPYTSFITFELYADAEQQHTVRILYSNGTNPEIEIPEPHLLVLPGCTEYCPFEYLEQYTKHLLPDNYKKECGSRTSCTSPTPLRISEFLEIAPSTIAELQSCAWIKSGCQNPAPNIMNFIKSFDNIMFWAMDLILAGATAQLRSTVLAHLLRTATRLHHLRNLHSTCAIVFALESLPVQRLHNTWKLLSSNKIKKFYKLQVLCSVENGYEKLKKHMQKQMFYNSRCIPYIVPYLNELLKIDSEHPGPDICNILRVVMMMQPISIIQNFQKSNYDALPTLPLIQKYILSLDFDSDQQHQMQDKSYKISLELEPLEEPFDSMSLSLSFEENEDCTALMFENKGYCSSEEGDGQVELLLDENVEYSRLKAMKFLFILMFIGVASAASLYENDAHDEEALSELNLQDILRKVKEHLKKNVDPEFLKEEIERLLGRGSELVKQLLQTLKERGRRKLMILIDALLDEEDEDVTLNGLGDYWEKIKDYFKDLKIDLHEKYSKFGEWVKDRVGKGMETSKDKLENIKAIAKEFARNAKGISKEVAAEAGEFFKTYKDDLGIVWDEIKEKIKEIKNRQD